MKNTGRRNIKGQGTILARQLSAEEKCKLTIWVFQNKDTCAKSTSLEIAKIASDALGFEVSQSSAHTIKNATFPELRRIRVKAVKSAESSCAVDMVMSLEKRVARIERELGMVTFQLQPS